MATLDIYANVLPKKVEEVFSDVEDKSSHKDRSI